MEYTGLSNSSGRGGNLERYNSYLFTRNIDIIAFLCASLGGIANMISFCILRTSSIINKRFGRLLINLAFANVVFCIIPMLSSGLDAARLTDEIRAGVNFTVFQFGVTNENDVTSAHDVTTSFGNTVTNGHDVTLLPDDTTRNDVAIWYDSGPLSCLYRFSVSLEWIYEFFPFLATTWLVVDQFMGVAFPLRHGLIFTPKVVVLLIVSTYVIPLVYLTVSTLTDATNQTRLDCTVIFFNRHRHMKYLDPHFVANGIFVASLFLINLLLYLLLMIMLRRQRVRHNISQSNQSKNQKKDGSNVYIIVSMLFCTLFVFWSPMVVLYFLTIFDHGVIGQWVTDTVGLITLLNPLSDAVVYGVRLKQVRNAYSSFFERIKLWPSNKP